MTGSPPCDAFSVLRHIGKNKRTAQEEADKLAGGREHSQAAVKAYRSQMTRGRLFLHEHPKSAASWKEPEIEALCAEDGVYYVSGPMCRWELMPDHSQEPVGYARKETGWLTNSRWIAHTLDKECTKKMHGKAWHRHVELWGKKAKEAAKYLLPLVRAVLRALRSELREGEIGSIDHGPSPHEPLISAQEEPIAEELENYWDDVRGGG